jgi:sugar phosphate isomerase/epimerase
MKQIMSRRNFVQSSAALLTSCATPIPLCALSQEQVKCGRTSPIHLGLASYSFQNFSRSQLITFMKHLRVTDLNVKDVGDHLPMASQEEAIALAEYAAAGINLHAAGDIPLQKDEDADMRSRFEYCKRAGISLMTVRDLLPEMLPRVEKFVRDYNIRVAINNRGPEDKAWPTPQSVVKSIANMDARIGCCVDVGHVVRAGGDVVQTLREIRPYLLNVHIKDTTNLTRTAMQCTVGEGSMPIGLIFQTLISTKYDGFVDLEYEVHPAEPMPGAIASFAYMRGLLSGMGYLNC